MLILGDMRELGAESAAEHQQNRGLPGKNVLLRKSCWLENNLQQQLITPYHTYANASGSDKGTANGKA